MRIDTYRVERNVPEIHKAKHVDDDEKDGESDEEGSVKVKAQ